MNKDLIQQWQTNFNQIIQTTNFANSLQQAGSRGELANWTKILTEAVVNTCRQIGWQASAKGYPLKIIPISSQEFLTMDVMAFPADSQRWQLPIAVMELENQRERTAYSLWKVLCVQVKLRIVFGYCNTTAERIELIRYLQTEVIQSISPQTRSLVEGETLIAIGSREEITAFPYGYFKWWKLDKNTGRFILN